MTASQVPAKSPSRRSRPAGAVLLILLLFAAVAVGGFWYAYQRLVGYQRTVAYHVPASARLALRVDLEQVVLFEPVRRHIFPVLKRQLADSDGLAELEEHTGIDLAMDLREVMFVQPASDAWLLVVGGLFPQSGVVAGLAELVRARGIVGCRLAEGRLACPQHAFFVEQAHDGALVLSSSPDALAASLGHGEAYAQLGLGVDDAAGFAADGEWVRSLARLSELPIVGHFAQDLAPLKQFRGVSGRVDLGTETHVVVQLNAREGGDLSSLQPAVERMLTATARLLAGLGHADVAGERTLLASATVRATEHGTIEVVSPWPREDIDRAAQTVADWLTRWGDSWVSRPNNQ